jgi:hypothetical protein
LDSVVVLVVVVVVVVDAKVGDEEVDENSLIELVDFLDE